MKLPKIINPKHISRSTTRFFRPKKDHSSLSGSDPSSFSSGTLCSTSSDISLSNHKPGSHGGGGGIGTPTSVLPCMSGDWSDFSCDIYYELVQAFKLIDKDNDGVVSRTELEKLLTLLGAEPPSREEVGAMLMEFEGDSGISVDALRCRIGVTAAEPAGDEELRETFEYFDTDGDGKITAEELLRFFTAIGDEQCTLEDCRRMIAGVDKNGDGFVCFEDFARLMDLSK